jgi:hypothetical protein
MRGRAYPSLGTGWNSNAYCGVGVYQRVGSMFNTPVRTQNRVRCEWPFAQVGVPVEVEERSSERLRVHCFAASRLNNGPAPPGLRL